jgi:hypothetical protein
MAGSAGVEVGGVNAFGYETPTARDRSLATRRSRRADRRRTVVPAELGLTSVRVFWRDIPNMPRYAVYVKRVV